MYAVYACLCVCLGCMPYMHALTITRWSRQYVITLSGNTMPYMNALLECLICMPFVHAPRMPYMYALYVCLICMPYMHGLCACPTCMPFMHG